MKLGITFRINERRELERDDLKMLVDAGFKSFWTGDHMVSSPARYKGTFGDSLMGLACIAAMVGPDITLGTNVLVGPLYEAARLNRAVATMASYSDHPIHLGVGVGWNTDDYASCGVDFSRRGQLLDQLIRDLRWMWADPMTRPEADGVSAEAQLVIELQSALPRSAPLILTGGGRTDKEGRLAPAVAWRIASSDGWIINPNSTMQEVEEDLATVAALGGNVQGPEQCISQALIHLAPEGMSSEDAKVEQRTAFLTQMLGSDRNTIQHVERCALIGTGEEILEQLQQKAEWGTDHIICVPVPTNDPDQMVRFARMCSKLQS